MMHIHNKKKTKGETRKDLRDEVKIKVTLEQAMKTYRGSRGIALFFL
jgi:hypothetical protein